MKWKKLGHIFSPKGEQEWMRSHAANPIADHIKDDIFRIYFSTRDSANRSNIAWIEIDIKDPQNILFTSKSPVIEPGLRGCFDDSGCSLGSIINYKGKKLLYYMGWNLGVTVPWRNSIGLAISEDNGQTYKRHSLAPILDRSHEDPYTLSYPWVIQDNDIWHMWYGSNLKWGAEKSDMYHMIKHATSLDGYSWQRDSETVINVQNESEYAFAKPCVVKHNDLFHMWYAYRGDKYRIGYADSKDGITWVRKDNVVGISTSLEGWDSDSMEYPCVFKYKDNLYMLYNGNEYGRTGIGLAVME
jgi:hypothetical protein